jgi:gluconolactonase
MAIVANSPKLFELIDPAAQVEQIVGDCTFTEGPIWNKAGAYLLFSDMPADKRRRWSEAGGVEVVADPARKCNGMTYDAHHNLIVCEHVTSSVVRERPDGVRETVAFHYQGKYLNSPNDVCVAQDGAIWFSDPPYGRWPGFGIERSQELDFQGVYRVDPSGELQLAIDDFAKPNGLCFSPDYSLLYVNDTDRAHIRVFEVGSGGKIGTGRVFAEGIGEGTFEGGLVDGMKCDELGNIWVTGPKGVWVFTPEGEHLGIVEIPEHVGNHTWGGADWKTLIVAASNGVYRVPTKVAAHREPYMA